MNAGDVVLLTFPYSDLSGSKFRPAVILADVGRGDYVACQVTSNREADADAVELTAASFSAGGLRIVSYARPGKLFAASRKIIARRVASPIDHARDDVKAAVVKVVQRG